MPTYTSEDGGVIVTFTEGKDLLGGLPVWVIPAIVGGIAGLLLIVALIVLARSGRPRAAYPYYTAYTALVH